MCETIDWLGVFKSKLQFEPLTESSKQEYYDIIKQYLKYISGIGKDIQTITSQEIEMWLNPSTPRTFNKRRTVLRRFYALLGVSSDVEQIPHQSYRTFPKGGKQCTHENIFHMLEILKNQASLDFYALRTYCAVLLIYVYGLRECEIRKVCIEAINLT
jgi:integrase